MEIIMRKTVRAALAALVVVAGTSSAFSAQYPTSPHRIHHGVWVHDPWFKPVHLDNPHVPAKTFFEQTQTDGG
jgi:hypothetical protein